MMDHLFGYSLEETTKNTENKDEPASVSTSTYRTLACHIDSKTNYLIEGVEHSLETTLEKKSPTLGRNCIYEKKGLISKLPRNLIVHFVRFFWRTDTKKKAKILRKVQFPEKLDLFNFCTDKLKLSLAAARRVLVEEEEKKLGLTSLTKKAPPLFPTKDEKKDEKKDTKTEAKTETTTSTTTSQTSQGVAPMDIDKVENPNVKNPPPLTDTSGFFELYAVVTHQGRMADAGHYIGWVRKTGDNWIKFDDDVVTEVKTDEIKALSGGGDWHMAYLAFYRRVDDFKGKTFTESALQTLPASGVFPPPPKLTTTSLVGGAGASGGED